MPNTSILNDPGRVSHWFKQLYPAGTPLVARPALTESLEADVCIVGAGYTGLWTAYALNRADPSLKVVVLEAEIAGYGASGRNGGAVIAQINGSRDYWTKRGGGREAAIAMERASQAAVADVGDAVKREGIECSYARNGVVMVARTPMEAHHFKASVDEDREWGFGEQDSRYLSSAEVLERINIEGALGARFSPHCASIHPGALVRGLADTVERLGTTIYEGTRVASIEPGVARLASGATVKARIVVRATEAYTESLKSHRRVMVPVHTSMFVTEVLPDSIWQELRWTGREALLAEHPFLHLQHTADHRITFGGDDNRIPYLYGSAPCPDEPSKASVAAMFRRELIRLFPALSDVRVDHAWQGIFAAPRNWAPGVDLDRETGLAWAGGYVGEGVANANLAGRTLADLILGQDTELTRLPLVGPAGRKWEPEPLRWIGAAGIAGIRHIGFRKEKRTDKPSKLIPLGDRITGFTGHLG
ncbi:MAG TPA: FAD-dependent oxidoreductase [Baekduia sp.]|nr:FAD-dependent oxidoreductase [Baekduia sp.]